MTNDIVQINKQTLTEIMLSIYKGGHTTKFKHLKALVAKLEEYGCTDESFMDYVENQNVFRIGIRVITKEQL